MTLKAEEDRFNVSGINVKKFSNNVTQARNTAINDGQRRAFEVLLRRLKVSPNYSLWVSNEDIGKMVSSIQINNEKITDNSYSATINVFFSEDFVKFMFQKYNIKSSSAPKNKYLVIPVVRNEEGIQIWGSENVWMDIWRNLMDEKGIKAITVIEKDIETLAAVNPEMIQFENPYDFDYLIKQYDVNTIIVAEAEHLVDEDKIQILFTQVSENNKDTVKLNFFNAEGYDEYTLFSNATEKTINYIIKVEGKTRSKDGNEKGVSVNVAVNGLKEYLDAKNLLENSEFIKKIKLKSLTKQVAVFHIEHSIEEELLSTAFEERGFRVYKQLDEYYLIFDNF